MAPLFDSRNPVQNAFGSNKLGPGAAYKFRKYWKERGMETGVLEATPVDFWYGKLFHGRVDEDGVVVYPSETNLKQVPGTRKSKTLWALDFVVDAFAEFSAHMKMARARGLISSEGIADLEPERAWASIHARYNIYMESLYDFLVTGWFQLELRNSKIKNFSEFLHEFMELVNVMAPHAPITKSAYILSNRFTPLASGLIIELSKDPHGEDINKQRRWTDDPNFAFYRASAKNFGFLLDKNAPWRLVADINSAAMAKYMDSYGVTGKDLFETYYYKCHFYDIEALKIYLIEMYNAYVIAYPHAKEIRTKQKGPGGIKTVSRLINRMPTDIAAVDGQYSPEFWLKTYYYIRLREMTTSFDPVKFNKELEKIFQTKKKFDFDRALEYINNRIRFIKVR